MGKIFSILQTVLDNGRICGKNAMPPDEWLRNIPGNEQAIKQLFIDLVGEDEDPDTTGRGFKTGYVTRENNLRAELRKKIQEL